MSGRHYLSPGPQANIYRGANFALGEFSTRKEITGWDENNAPNTLTITVFDDLDNKLAGGDITVAPIWDTNDPERFQVTGTAAATTALTNPNDAVMAGRSYRYELTGDKGDDVWVLAGGELALENSIKIAPAGAADGVPQPYLQPTDLIAESAGSADAGKPIKLSSTLGKRGKTDVSVTGVDVNEAGETGIGASPSPGYALATKLIASEGGVQELRPGYQPDSPVASYTLGLRDAGVKYFPNLFPTTTQWTRVATGLLINATPHSHTFEIDNGRSGGGDLAFTITLLAGSSSANIYGGPAYNFAVIDRMYMGASDGLKIAALVENGMLIFYYKFGQEKRTFPRIRAWVANNRSYRKIQEQWATATCSLVEELAIPATAVPIPTKNEVNDLTVHGTPYSNSAQFQPIASDALAHNLYPITTKMVDAYVAEAGGLYIKEPNGNLGHSSQHWTVNMLAQGHEAGWAAFMEAFSAEYPDLDPDEVTTRLNAILPGEPIRIPDEGLIVFPEGHDPHNPATALKLPIDYAGNLIEVEKIPAEFEQVEVSPAVKADPENGIEAQDAIFEEREVKAASFTSEKWFYASRGRNNRDLGNYLTLNWVAHHNSKRIHATETLLETVQGATTIAALRSAIVQFAETQLP